MDHSACLQMHMYHSILFYLQSVCPAVNEEGSQRDSYVRYWWYTAEPLGTPGTKNTIIACFGFNAPQTLTSLFPYSALENKSAAFLQMHHDQWADQGMSPDANLKNCAIMVELLWQGLESNNMFVQMKKGAICKMLSLSLGLWCCGLARQVVLHLTTWKLDSAIHFIHYTFKYSILFYAWYVKWKKSHIN